MNETRIARFIIFGFVAFILLTVSVYIATSPMKLGERYRPISELGGPFTLSSSAGDFSLSDLKGKAVVLYFGFLSCTEACPASIGVFQMALSRLNEQEQENVQFVLISIDPERDTLQDLEDFDDYYLNEVLSVTGTQIQIDAVTDQYGVYFDLVDLEGSALQYTVDHSSRFYMIDTEGTLVTTMSHSTTSTELAARIRQLLPS